MTLGQSGPYLASQGVSLYPVEQYPIHFSWYWPNPPTITNTVTVTPATLSANNLNNTRLILQAGDYGNVSTSNNNQEWILKPNALINEFDYTSAQKLKVRGESPRVGRIGQFKATANGSTADIHFDGIYQSNGAWSTNTDTWNAPTGIRVAITNSSLNTGSYNLFATSPNSDYWNNLIVAGNYIRSSPDVPMGVANDPQHCIRLMQPNNFIFVDNYIQKGGDGMIFRVHTDDTPTLDCFNGYIANNVLVAEEGYTYFAGFQIYPASSGYTPANLIDLTYDNNEIHMSNGGAIAFDTDTWNNNIIRPKVTNNFVNGTLGFFTEDMFINATFSNNTEQTYSSGSVPTAASKLGWTP